MLKYFVKSVSVATDENVNFRGSVYTYYNGKQDQVIGSFGDPYLREGIYGYAREYGYSTAAQAKRCYSFRHPENSKNWKTTVEIVCLDV